MEQFLSYYEYECAYLPGRRAAMEAFRVNRALPPGTMDELLALGFRRSGTLYYRNACPECRACLPYRVPVASFASNRSQRRTHERNHDLVVSVNDAPVRTAEKDALYLHYYRSRHDEWNCCRGDAYDDAGVLGIMQSQMMENNGNTRELEFRDGNQLVGFSTVDYGRHALSAVYTAFDPAYGRRAPGVFAVLAMLDYARANGFRWLYLGFLIENHPKMGYKARYAPGEYLDETTVWRKYHGTNA